MSAKSPAFDPKDVPESNATAIPEPFTRDNQNRYNRRISDFAGLKNYGVILTRIIPGGQSSYRHAHTRQDEFVYVLEGPVTLETTTGKQVLDSGMCAGFPAGTGDAHRFVNHTDKDALLLVVGDRSQGDEVSYPDVDMKAAYGADGKFRFTRKDGTPL
ncbi:MAG: cupin domain-containing protein [Hyphomicrobiaceae bacterium]